MAVSTESASARRLPMELKTYLISVHPNGNSAYHYNKITKCFFKINMNDGQKCPIETEPLKKMVDGGQVNDVQVIIRNSKTFALVLIMEDATKKNFLVSFLVCDSKISFIHEHYLGVTGIKEKFAQIATDEKEQIYFTSFWWTNSANEKSTLFDAIKIEIDNEGNISSNILFDNFELTGTWFHPFVRSNDSIYFLELCDKTDERLRSISLSSRNVVDVQIRNENENSLNEEGIMWIPPTTIGNQIFYYVFNKTKKLGDLVYCDWNLKCWKKLRVDMNEHVIIGNSWERLDHSYDGRLYLHGICSLESCEEKAHMYIINVKNKLQWTPTNYDKKEKLGRGQFGVVYKCWDKGRKRFFVAKYSILQSDQHMEAADNEVKRLKDLNHHRIIEYYGCKSENESIVIFMEYMPLGSIRQLIDQDGAISEETAIIYTGQILEGLAYIHDKGIVHSDLKCDNILSDTNGNVKIGDFGIAVQKILRADKTYLNSKSLGIGGGTMLWMAPEVITEQEIVSRKSDMWSLGCTIVEMLTTKPPYPEMTHFQLINALIRNSLTYDIQELFVSEIRKPFTIFLRNLLQIDPAKRLKTGTDGIEKFQELGLG